jgi:uncharacterized phage protein gp47/JayE
MADNKDTIQARMLTNISNEFDKTEGSFFYDATKPVAIELEKLDSKSDIILDNGFADTAEKVYLDRLAAERGVYRKGATKSNGIVTIIGVVGALVVAGEMVASDNVNFVFKENLTIPVGGSIDVIVECEQYGTIGNVPIGSIKYFPKTLDGLQTVINAQAFTNGYEAESDVSLRERYYTVIQTPATSGNKYHYLNWAKEVVGVGDARVFPLANGAGTVEILIINANKRAADTTLIDEVTAYIEENRPIGATVTILSATEKVIAVTVTLVIDDDNYTIAEVTETIENNLTAHFAGIAFVDTYVSYAKIGSIIFDSQGVLDYSNLLVNTGTANIAIADTEIAVLGGVTVG